MKDSLTNNQFSTKTADSIRKDLNGIRCEIREYTKSQKQDNSSVTNDTVFTVFVTLAIFILGIIIDRLLKWCDKKKSENELKSFFIYHLNRTNSKLVNKLKDVYLKYSEDISIDTGITSTPPKVLSSDFQRLLNTNYEELFKAYVNKDAFSKILSQIEFVDKVQIEVNGFHDRVYADSGQVRDEIEKLSDEYLSLLSEFTSAQKKNNVRYESSETYKLIYTSIKVYYTELAGTRQLSVFYKDIVRAILERIVQTGEYEVDPILKNVAEKARELSHQVSKLKLKTTEIANQYKVYSDYMDEANKALTTTIPDLK